MADADYSKLESIFRMITPADVLGAQAITLGNKQQDNVVTQVLDIMYNIGTGALSIDTMIKKLDELVTSQDEDAKKKIKRILSIYSSGQVKPKFVGKAQDLGVESDGKTLLNTVSFDRIVGTQNKLNKQTMGIIMCNSSFLSPAVRNAERVEMFLNSLQTLIASRMVPLLDVEFSLVRVSEKDSKTSSAWAPGMLRFLLGADADALKIDSNKKLYDSRYSTPQQTNTNDSTYLTQNATAGMEMFTSPQLLVNPEQAKKQSDRYVDVLDPFRPFMSLESFTINVTPTVGLYTYKKGTLVFTLHDRSRLAEIADFIRPQVYQNKDTAPTVWITYGWRHPNEANNPYAEFINGNMLVREAYQIINSSFSFDQTGQVKITMELWTKGLPDLRTLKITHGPNSDKSVFDELQQISKRITEYRRTLNLPTDAGTNKEIRSFMIMDAAERGEWPDFSKDEIKNAIDALNKTLTKDNTLDHTAAQNLVDSLKKLYVDKNKDGTFRDRLKKNITSVVNEKFKEVMVGPDPFLPSSKKDEIAKQESDKNPHPISTLVDSINAYNADEYDAKVKGFKKHVASFGKLMSVFIATALPSLSNVDELQLYFYQFNDHAGASRGQNIASFPIDMPVLLQQYAEMVERGGTENITLESFMRLVIDAQLHDVRSIGYGFRQYYAPFDPSNPDSVVTKKNQEDAAQLAEGAFQKPVIEVHVECVNTNQQGASKDRLSEFEKTSASGKSDQYRSIVRIHVYDKTNNPYSIASTILRSDSDSNSFLTINNQQVKDAVEQAKSQNNGQNLTLQQLKLLVPSLTSDVKIDKTALDPNGKSGLSNQAIKEYISKTVPTITYGTNASSVISANLASKQDPLLSTTQMQGVANKTGKPETLQPNGGGKGGLPLRIVPASLTLTALGCPLLAPAQLYFVDFNTGTTADNLYLLTGLTHTISPGKFESNLTLTFADAYGKYEGATTVTEYIKSLVIPEEKPKNK